MRRLFVVMLMSHLHIVLTEFSCTSRILSFLCTCIISRQYSSLAYAPKVFTCSLSNVQYIRESLRALSLRTRPPVSYHVLPFHTYLVPDWFWPSTLQYKCFLYLNHLLLGLIPFYPAPLPSRF